MKNHAAFTMIELLLAVSLLAVIVVVGYMSFSTATTVWRVGQNAADSIHHGDFVMGQITMALRSAYYPDSSSVVPEYGMQLINDGEKEEARDSLMWVKLGSALVGQGAEVANAPHKIVLYSLGPGESANDKYSEGGIFIKTWRTSSLPDEFDAEDEEYVKPFLVAPGVVAMDIQVLDPADNLAKGQSPKIRTSEWEEDFQWIDEDWRDDYTNRLPYAVKATIYLPPSEEGGSPIPVSRVIQIPTAPLSWRDKGAAGGKTQTSGAEKKKGKAKVTPKK